MYTQRYVEAEDCSATERAYPARGAGRPLCRPHSRGAKPADLPVVLKSSSSSTDAARILTSLCRHRCSACRRGDRMNRRGSITLLGGAAAGRWRGARSRRPSAGRLLSGRPDPEALLLSSFGKGLEGEGFTIGKNVAIEYRFSDGDETVAVQLRFRSPPDGRYCRNGTPALAAKVATSTVPTVFSTGVDPVARVRCQHDPVGGSDGVAVFTISVGGWDCYTKPQSRPDCVYRVSARCHQPVADRGGAGRRPGHRAENSCRERVDAR